ncbi:MAG: type II toxin-antitoxin system Phd/YefM family antitoxin [Thermoleophilia bacterium]
MTKIGAYEAKTHLPKLLERVKKGERFVITKHGNPVAELVPIAGSDPEKAKAAIEDLNELRATLKQRGVYLKDLLGKDESIRDLAHKGHRF